MNTFFDTHCHLILPNEENFSPFADYLQRAQQAGVDTLMLAAAHLPAAQFYAQCAQQQPQVYYAAGLHPHDSDKTEINPLAEFDAFRNDPKLKAIGEIGLDYFYEFSDRSSQIKTFEYFLERALEWQLPAIIHCRDKTSDGPAYADCFALLRDFAKDGGRFVLHCFAGSLDYAEQCFELGGYAGVTGIVTFRQSDNIREFVRMAPIDRLFLETDSPYLAPIPHRGKQNHPAYLPLIAQKVAEVRGITLDECAQITTQNACQFFNISSSLN